MSPSTRRFVSKLGQQEPVAQVFLASEKQLRPNRSGQLYLQVALSDRSGSIDARLWNASDQDYRSFENGDYVLVEGTTQLFQGNVQLIANRIRRVPADEVHEEDFRMLSVGHRDELVARLAEILRTVRSAPLKALVECFLADERFMRRFATAPAAMKHHHAYEGGLLDHVVQLLDLCGRVADCYPELDRELLLMGAFLHDVGKIDELCYDRTISYTDAGQLLGHIVMAMQIIDEKVRDAERASGQPIPESLVVELKHLVVSHHGQYEYGSPKLPMTLEATALHYLDSLDAKLHAFGQLIRNDANVDSPWTPYYANLGRKLYKKTEGPGPK